MAGPLVFKSVPISNENFNWDTNSYTNIDEGQTSGSGDASDIIADDNDEGDTQTYNHDKPPAYSNVDQIKWHVRTGSEMSSTVTCNIYVDGAWQSSLFLHTANTDYTQTLTGSFTDFSTFQVRFIAPGSIGKNEECRIEYSTIEIFGYGTTNIKGGDVKGGNIAPD